MSNEVKLNNDEVNEVLDFCFHLLIANRGGQPNIFGILEEFNKLNDAQRNNVIERLRNDHNELK